MKAKKKWSGRTGKNNHIRRLLIDKIMAQEISAMETSTFLLYKFIDVWKNETYYNEEPLCSWK